jgi:putative ATP-dependent endonuclease of the OLD family
MKIRQLTIENVTSYKERTTFDFENGLNIVIGPNGGGKTNLQRILAMVISHWFIRQHDFYESEDETGVRMVDLWNAKALRRKLEPFLGQEDKDQLIEIVLVPDEADVENIRTIAANLERFNEHLAYWQSPFTSYDPAQSVEAIAAADSFTYRIKNLEMVGPEPGTPAWAFKEYLRTFLLFLRLSSRMPDVRLTSPAFFFFSERTTGGNARVQTNQFAESTYYSGYRNAQQAASGDSTNLLQWGTQHFARLYHRAVYSVAESGESASAVYSEEPDVKLLNQYLAELGYEWNFWTDDDRVSFTFWLRRAGGKLALTIDRFSSGEREVVHFLLALFALNVRDGVVLVDEPELHLHPRWQRTFLGLFTDLAPSRNNQFLITTHSPVFVTPDTVDNITRVYRSLTGGTAKVGLRDVTLPEKKSLVRMINSQNNERVFFADKAVLVEGISDRLVLASLLDSASVLFRNYEAVEIIEVGGKGNFKEYRTLLDALATPSFIVADQDYLLETGSARAGQLFASDDRKAWKKLRGKKSDDSQSFLALLRQATRDGDTDNLEAFLEYMESRAQRLIHPLTDELRAVFEDELSVLRDDRVFVLSFGEIEDYLPAGVRSVKEVVEFTTDRNWINRVPDASHRIELGSIICEILEIDDPQRTAFLAALEAGTVEFPEPVTQVGDPDERVADETSADVGEETAHV